MHPLQPSCNHYIMQDQCKNSAMPSSVQDEEAHLQSTPNDDPKEPEQYRRDHADASGKEAGWREWWDSLHQRSRIIIMVSLTLGIISVFAAILINLTSTKGSSTKDQDTTLNEDPITPCSEVITDGFDNPLIGNGFCNGGPFMSKSCGNDGGDCDDCSIHLPPSFGVENIVFETKSILAVDVNNDGYIDLILAIAGSPNKLYINDGESDTSFQPPIDLPGGSLQSTIISPVDVNNDGFIDLVIGNAGSVTSPQPNQILVNNGSGASSTGNQFQEPMDLPGDAMFTFAIVVSDVDNDGLVDIIIGNYNEVNQLFINNSQLAKGIVSFKDPLEMQGGNVHTYTITVADINNDGALDAIFGNYGEPNQFLMSEDIVSGFENAYDLPGGSENTRVIVASDVNNDGFVDLVVGNNRDSPNHLLLHSGEGGADGPYNEVIELPGGIQWTHDIVAADVNNDGFVDLIIGNFNTSNQLLLNTGKSTDEDSIFEEVIDFPCSEEGKTNSISVADMNGDGYFDIMFGNAYQKSQLLINIGDGVSYKEPAGEYSSWLPI